MNIEPKNPPTWSNPYATKSIVELLTAAAELDLAATPQPWMIASSNSYRRINACSRDARDGGVISGTVAPDGVPDLTGDNLNSDLRFVSEARSPLPELCTRLAACLAYIRDMNTMTRYADQRYEALLEKLIRDAKLTRVDVCAETEGHSG